MRLWLTYAVALAIGLATPLAVLWIGRKTPVGTDPELAGASVVLALAIVSALLTAALPRHWLAIALVLSVPVCVLGIVMFVVVASLGEYFWAWLWSAIGGVAAALAGAYVVAGSRRP